LVTGVSEESVAEYLDRVMSWLKNPSWWGGPERPLDPVLVERFAYYFRRGIELLDAVPRDDPFWQKTNMKATTFKASIWFRQVLDADPGDAEARWILTALSVAPYGGPIQYLAPLVPEDPYILRWLVDLAVWNTRQGDDFSADLREELHKLENDPAVRSLLEGPAENDELGRSVKVARSVLAGKSITEAVDGLTLPD